MTTGEKTDQRKHSLEAAKEHEIEMGESAFEQAVQQIASPQPIKPRNEKGERDDHAK